MKYLIPLFATLIVLATAFISPFNSPSKNALKGAWELVPSESSDSKSTGIMSCSDAYWSLTFFNTETKVFDFTTGGTYKLEQNQFITTTEFHSLDTTQIGQTSTIDIEFLSEEEIMLNAAVDGELVQERFVRIDDASTPLAGNWNFHSRKRNGEMQERKPGPRKTVKLLTGTRFQWAAINTETKQFFGTGGGTYTFEDGVYTEHIEFFSRDSSRVGMSLSFEGRVDGEDWHHSGKSSKGKPIYEVWRRE